MKKVLIVLLLMFVTINLASCDNLPGGSNNSGNLGDGTTVVFKDGTKILLNDSTDGVEVYNTIIKNYVEGTTYDLSAKIYKIGDKPRRVVQTGCRDVGAFFAPEFVEK